MLKADGEVVARHPYTPIQLNYSPLDHTILLPYEEVLLYAGASDMDSYDWYNPETQEMVYDDQVGDSVNSGEIEARHHIEWSIASGHGSLPYGRFGLWEEPYEVPECFEHQRLIYRAGGPTEAGHVILHLTVDDNDFDPDLDEEPEAHWIRSDDGALEQDINIWVMEVVNLTWEKYSDNRDLDNCPNNGGKRIFPEKKTYDDTADYRTRVKLKISLSCPVPEGKSVGVKVKLFDVDDPKYSDGPVDWETPVKYNDNQCNDRTAAGSDIGASPGGAGPQRETTVVFTGGEQEKPVVVSINDRRPGNNWKAVASTRGDWLNGVHLDTDGLTFKDGDNQPVPDQCISPMLTVWRTLHVEFDRMPQAEEDEPFGTKSGESSEGITASSLTDEVLAPWDPSGFIGAVLDPDAATAPTSIGVDANGLWLGFWEVTGGGTDGELGHVTVRTDYRDDKIDNDVDVTIDEEDENWTMAGYQAGAPFAVNTDDPEWLVELQPPAPAGIVAAMVQYFKPAYIHVVQQTEGNQHQETESFERNHDNPWPGTGDLDVPGSNDFWCVRILWAYDCERKSVNLNPGDAPMGAYGGDWDPDREGVPAWAPLGTALSTLGHATAIPGESADIYPETHRDRGMVADLGRTVTHESGHLLGLHHADPHYNPATGDINPDAADKGLMGFAKPLEISYQAWYELLEQHGIRYQDQGMNQLSLRSVKLLRQNASD